MEVLRKYKPNPNDTLNVLGEGESTRTAAERFALLAQKAKNATLDDVKEAFSVEKLSKEFFNEYKEHYDAFCGYMMKTPGIRSAIFKGDEKAIRDFVKKLLGRIVFLYFVQKKGWLGASDTNYTNGMPDFIQQLFIQSGGNNDFYSNWLTKLFFETLNKERTNDDFTLPNGKIVKVPFLNGGLFDKEEFDEYLLTFPAKMFHNPDFKDEILTAKSNSNARGFLDFLDAFNFTIYENDPNEHTVAVDPEMLGHIFENLLEDNKDKGAFYTPKEIVHYMCQESLMQYLFTWFENKGYDLNEEIRLFIEKLFKNQLDDTDKPLVSRYANELHQALDKVKICDPAIGSGAFPMGLLQEIFNAKQTLWYFEHGNLKDFPASEVKLNIIQNSIYGVDIEKGAVDIARLRFWLSLVVDEEKPKPLPNLDYKIVVGDSLIGKFDGEVIEIDWEIKEGTQTDIFGNENLQKRKKLLETLTEKQRKYFEPNSKNKKVLALEIRNHKIDVLINQLQHMVKTEGLEQMPVKTNFQDNKKFVAALELYLKTQGWLNTIKKLERLKQHPELHFNHFDWKLDFPEVLNPYLVNDKGGFDIVIGNPPYIQLQKDGGRLAKELEKQPFQTFARTGDIYALFYEKGLNLLKTNGVLCYITSNKWMRAGYGEKLRQYFLQYNPLKLIDLGPGIFESATVDTNILLVQKDKNQHQLHAVTLQKNENQIDIAQQLEQQGVVLKNLTKDAWFIGSDAEQRLKEKIERIGKPLKDWNVKIYRGIITGLNEAFIITTEKRNEILANCRDKEERKRTEAIIKPILRGRDIKRYHYEWAGLWVLWVYQGIDIQRYQSIYNHLLPYKEKLQKRTGGAKIAGDPSTVPYKWYELQVDSAAHIFEYEKEKVVWAETIKIYFDGTRNYPRFAYTSKGFFLDKTTFFMSGSQQKYFLGVLNSEVGKYLLENGYCVKLGTGSRGLQKILVENLPIPPIMPANEPIVQQIEGLVDNILAAKQQNPQSDTSHWEQEIDRLVYELYGLTEEEIRIIEK